MRGRICTIDVEDWHHTNLPTGPKADPATSILPESMPLILDLFAQYSVQATFFVLAEVLPQLKSFRQRLIDSGHEIASHGLSHEMATRMDAREFTKDVTESKKRLEDAFGVEVHGYRAPSWSIQKDNCAFWKILQACGYSYDASVFPLRTFLYGFPEAPKGPFLISLNGERLALVSVPCSTVEFLGRTMAFSGGFFLRALPSFLINRFSREVWSRNLPVVYYFHPREVLTSQPIPDLGFRDRLIQTYGLSTTVRKLRQILNLGGFLTMHDYVGSLEPGSLPVYEASCDLSIPGDNPLT